MNAYLRSSIYPGLFNKQTRNNKQYIYGTGIKPSSN